MKILQSEDRDLLNNNDLPKESNQMAWEYSDKVRELFINAFRDPEKSHYGEIKAPDGVGRHGSIACGDAIVFYFRVQKNKLNPLKDKIIEAKFKTFGCTSAIASSEALCIIIEEKKLTPLEALKITSEEIVKFLGGMPRQKIHCSVMGAEVLREAVCDWALKRGVGLAELGGFPDEIQGDEGIITCECYGLTDNYLKRKIKELNLKSVEEISEALKAGGGCGTCIDYPRGIRDILSEIYSKDNIAMDGPKKDLDQSTDVEIKDDVSSLIESSIKPRLKKEKIDLDLIDVKGTKVYCQFDIRKDSLENSDFSIKDMVEKQLQEKIDPDIKIIEI